MVNLSKRPTLCSRVVANTAWLIGDRLIRIVLGLVVGVWIARYLGPADFGKYSYAFAVISIFGAMTPLGLHPIVVRDIVREPRDSQELIANAFIAYAAFSLGVSAFICFAVAPLLGNELAIENAIIILSSTLFIKSTDIFKTWFEAQIQSKAIALLESTAFVLVSALKVLLILLEKSLMAFVWAAVLEALLVAAGLVWWHRRKSGALQLEHFSLNRTRSLLKQSWPLMLSGLTIVIYMRIDQVMLGEMLGDVSVGIYSTAIRVSEAWYFLPTTIAASVYPAIAALKKNSTAAYTEKNELLFSGLVWLAIGAALLTTIFADRLIALAFGAPYASAADILIIHTWSAIFVFLGVASNYWLVNEGLQRFAFLRALMGAMLNILFNLALIPSIGGEGAAYGTLIAQAFSSYFFDLLHPDTRPLFWMKTKALYPKILAIMLAQRLRTLAN